MSTARAGRQRAVWPGEGLLTLYPTAGFAAARPVWPACRLW